MQCNYAFVKAYMLDVWIIFSIFLNIGLTRIQMHKLFFLFILKILNYHHFRILIFLPKYFALFLNIYNESMYVWNWVHVCILLCMYVRMYVYMFVYMCSLYPLTIWQPLSHVFMLTFDFTNRASGGSILSSDPHMLPWNKFQKPVKHHVERNSEGRLRGSQTLLPIRRWMGCSSTPKNVKFK